MSTQTELAQFSELIEQIGKSIELLSNPIDIATDTLKSKMSWTDWNHRRSLLLIMSKTTRAKNKHHG